MIRAAASVIVALAEAQRVAENVARDIGTYAIGRRAERGLQQSHANNRQRKPMRCDRGFAAGSDHVHGIAWQPVRLKPSRACGIMPGAAVQGVFAEKR